MLENKQTEQVKVSDNTDKPSPQKLNWVFILVIIMEYITHTANEYNMTK